MGFINQFLWWDRGKLNYSERGGEKVSSWAVLEKRE